MGGGKIRSVLSSKVSSFVSGGGGGQRSFGNGGAVQLESLGGSREGDGGEGGRRPETGRESMGSRVGIIRKTVDWDVRDEEQGAGLGVGVGMGVGEGDLRAAGGRRR